MAGRVRTRWKTALGWILGAFALVAVVAGVLYGLWVNGAFLPAWIQWENRYVAAELDGDPAFEAVVLEDRQLALGDDGVRVAGVLPEGWYTSDVAVADVDHDGTAELVTLTWKRGSFGPSKPFWVDRDSPEFSQHVAIFTVEDGALRQKWVSSALDWPIASLAADGYGRLHLTDPEGLERVCEWQTFGLAYLDEGNPSGYEATDALATVLVAGDVIGHEGVQAAPAAAFEPVGEWIAGFDHAVVNLETPLVADGSLASSRFPRFAAGYELGDGLVAAGFDGFALANNHIADAGEAGIADTLGYLGAREGLAAAGVAAAEGGDGIAVLEANGVTIALVNATFGLNDGGDPGRYAVARCDDPAAVAARVREAAGRADVTVCYLHAGEEYAAAPDEGVREQVAAAVDAGGAVVLVSHPHVAQPCEVVTTADGRRAYVAYSLGNFAANQPYPETVLGLVASFGVEKPRDVTGDAAAAEVVNFQVTPVVDAVAEGAVAVVPLANYTAEAAADHVVNAHDAGAVTLDGLVDQFVSLTR